MMGIKAYFVATCHHNTSEYLCDPDEFVVESGPYFTKEQATVAAETSTLPMECHDKRIVISGIIELRCWSQER